jgi:hypothetical protein
MTTAAATHNKRKRFTKTRFGTTTATAAAVTLATLSVTDARSTSATQPVHSSAAASAPVSVSHQSGRTRLHAVLTRRR